MQIALTLGGAILGVLVSIAVHKNSPCSAKSWRTCPLTYGFGLGAGFIGFAIATTLT